MAGVEILTGRLPPGLDLVHGPTKIIGVPTRAGSFSFQVVVRGPICAGETLADFANNFTIVVTGN